MSIGAQSIESNIRNTGLGIAEAKPEAAIMELLAVGGVLVIAFLLALSLQWSLLAVILRGLTRPELPEPRR
jgi:hypothetical protein